METNHLQGAHSRALSYCLHHAVHATCTKGTAMRTGRQRTCQWLRSAVQHTSQAAGQEQGHRKEGGSLGQ